MSTFSYLYAVCICDNLPLSSTLRFLFFPPPWRPSGAIFTRVLDKLGFDLASLIASARIHQLGVKFIRCLIDYLPLCV